MYDDLGIGLYRPSATLYTASTEGVTQRGAESGATAQLRGGDVASLSGRASAGAPVSAEEVLSRLHELGVVESASREVRPSAQERAGASAELELRLHAQAPQDSARPAETAAEEWRPYTRQASVAAPPATLLSSDGNVRLSLFPGAEGADFTKLESLLDALGSGTLLAGFADGSFRMLSLDMELLLELLDAGMASLTLPEGAKEEAAAPEAEEGRMAQTQAQPQEQTRTQTDTRAQTATIPAPFAGSGSFPPHATLSRAEAAALAKALRPDTSALPRALGEPGGALRWAETRSAALDAQRETAQWLRQTPEPGKTPVPDAAARAFATPDGGARMGGGTDAAGKSAETWGSGATAAPESAVQTASTHQASPPAASAAAGAAGAEASAGTEEGAVNFLRAVLTAARHTPEEAQSAALLLQYAVDGSWSKRDETGEMSRRLADLLAQLQSGKAQLNTRAHAETMELPDPPPDQQQEGELEQSWKRRRIAYEVEHSWTGNLKNWLSHVDGWTLDEGQSYVNRQVNVWATDLMENQRPQFRQWLTSPLRYAASRGWFNGVTGSFPIETLPDGFTEEDFRRWVRWDVLDYL